MGQVNVTQERTELTVVDMSQQVLRQASENWRNLRSSVDTVKDALAATGVVIGAGAMGKLYLDVVRADASLVDFSESTGASVEGLSRLREIASLGRRDFEGFTDQIGRMIKGLKSGDESGQLASFALKRLGVDAKDTNGVFRDTAAIQFDIANALAKYADDGNKAAQIEDIMGKGAQRYLPFYKDMVRFREQEAAVTAAQARAAKEYEIQVARVNSVLEEQRRQLASEYLPTITRVFEQMEYGTKVAGGLGNAIRLFGMLDPGPAVAENIKKITAELDRWQQGGAFYRFMNKPLGASYAGTENDMKLQLDFLKFMQRQQALEGRTGEQFLDARDLAAHPAFKPSSGYQSPNLGNRLTLSPFQNRMLEMRQQSLLEQTGPSEFIETAQAIKAGKYTVIDQTTGAVRKLTEAEKQLLLAAAADRDTQRDLRVQREAMTKANEEAQKAADDYYKALVTEAEQMKLLIEPGRQYLLEQDKLNEMVRQGLLTQEQAVQAQRKLLEARTQVQDLGMSADVAADATKQIGLSFTSAMDQVVFNSDRGIHALDLLRAAALDVAKIIFTRGFSEPTAKYIQSGLAGLFSGGGSSTGTGMTPETVDFLPFASGGVMTSRGPLPLRRYDGGGIADSPQLAMFGEGATAEAYVPLPDGRRIPVQMSGQSGHTFVIDARGADRSGLARLEAMIRRIDGSVEYRAVASVRRAAAVRGRSTAY